MTRTGAVVTFVTLAACASTLATLGPNEPTTDQAVRAAATALQFAHSLPSVILKGPNDLTCRNSPGTQMDGFGAAVVRGDFTCQAGTHYGSDQIVLAVPAGARWFEVALCHEMTHIKTLWDSGGKDDNMGHRPPFYAVSDACDASLKCALYPTIEGSCKPN